MDHRPNEPPPGGDGDDHSAFATPEASLAEPRPTNTGLRTTAVPPYSENPYLAEQMQPDPNIEPQASERSTQPTGRRSAESVQPLPAAHRPESHAADRASIGNQSTSTHRKGLASIRNYFRRTSLSSRRSHAATGIREEGAENGEHSEGTPPSGENADGTPIDDANITPEQYEKRLEDPQHLLNTILEEPSEDQLTPVSEAAATLPGNASILAAAMPMQRRQGYRENLLRTRRLRKHTRASRSVATLRKWWNKIMSWALITRVFVYWLPLALILFVPLGVGAWQNTSMKLGGTRVMWIFIWLEVVWASLWIGKLFAHYMPEIAGYLISVFVPTYFKYVDMILSLELPVQLLIWTFVSFITFTPILWDNADAVSGDVRPHWQKVVQSVCVALLVSAIVFFVEQVFIYIVSTSFHRERLSLRIEQQKKSVHVLIILLDTAYSFFPRGSDEFAEEDESLRYAALKRVHKKANSKSKVIQKVNNAVGNATKGMSNLMEASGMQSRPQSDKRPGAAKIVKNALTNKDTREVLACRIWKSLVMEDSHSLAYDDLISIFGLERKEEVLYMFDILDSDGQDGIDLNEMIESVHRIGRESKQISRSLVDMNGAIRKLHYLLMCIALVLIVVIFVGMLAPSSGSTLATLGSTLLSLSWLFASTAQEVFQACIFLFVKHPYDVGDWIETTVPSMGIVRMRCAQLNLMYSVFNQIGLNTRHQVSHAVLNSQFIANISRSPPSQVNIVLIIGVPETTPEQLDEFADRLNEFVESNPRDFAPGVFLEIINQTDLDRMSLNVGINIRNNQDDIGLFSVRRTRVFEFIGRCINEIPLTVPRRDEHAQNDPAVPVFQYNIKDIDEAMEYVEKARGRRRPVGMIHQPEDDNSDSGTATGIKDTEELGQVKSSATAAAAFQRQRRGSHSSRATTRSRVSRQFSTTSRATLSMGLRSRNQVQNSEGPK